SSSIMSQHYAVEPERPRARNPQVSEELESVIQSLLQKRPGDRPASGAMVADALRHEIEQIRERERSGVPVGAPVAPGPALSKTPGYTAAPSTEARRPDAPTAEKATASRAVPGVSHTELGPSIESVATHLPAGTRPTGVGQAATSARPAATVA